MQSPWESYLVRYFNGFVFGVVFVVLIGVELGIFGDLLKALSGDLVCGGGVRCIKPDLMPLFIFVLLAAMCFSYVASTPITVLHAGRFGQWFFERNSRYFWLSWAIFSVFCVALNFGFLGRYPVWEFISCMPVLVLCISSVFRRIFWNNWGAISKLRGLSQKRKFLFLIIVWLMFLYGVSGRISYLLPKSEIHWIILSLPSLWICCAQYSSLLKQIFSQKDFIDFYRNLFLARARSNSRDIRDSYTHLREHSNSIFIVVLEMSIFSLAMMFLPAYDRRAVSVSGFGAHAMVFVVVWMIPTVFMWSRANALERDFLKNPDEYFNSRLDPEDSSLKCNTSPNG